MTKEGSECREERDSWRGGGGDIFLSCKVWLEDKKLGKRPPPTEIWTNRPLEDVDTQSWHSRQLFKLLFCLLKCLFFKKYKLICIALFSRNEKDFQPAATCKHFFKECCLHSPKLLVSVAWTCSIRQARVWWLKVDQMNSKILHFFSFYGPLKSRFTRETLTWHHTVCCFCLFSCLLRFFMGCFYCTVFHLKLS